MSLQTLYTENPDGGFPGMVPNGETSNRISRTTLDEDGIAFGVPVFRGEMAGTCTASSDRPLLGFSVSHSALPVLPGAGPDRYAKFDSVTILTSGPLCIVAGASVTKGQQVYIVPETRAIVPTASGNIEAVGWVFDQDASSGQVARIARR